MDVHIREVDTTVWRAIRAEAIQRGITVGALIQDMWRAYLLEKGRAARAQRAEG